jgi:hypothetical protein
MGNILKGLSEILSNNGSIIDALTGSQAGSDSNIFNLSETIGESSSPGKQGNSHIFSEDGKFLRSQSMSYTPSFANRGSNIYIEKGDKSKTLILLTEYPITTETIPNLAKLFQTYAASIKIPVGENNKVELMDHTKAPGGSSATQRPLMFSLGTDIFVNIEGGKLNSNFSDYYNVRNTLFHEYNHGLNHLKKVNDSEGDGHFEHAKVYFEQIKHETFKKCTLSLQRGALGSMTQIYLFKSITEQGLQDSVIESFIVKDVNPILKSYKSELTFYFEVSFRRTGTNVGDFTIKIDEKR